MFEIETFGVPALLLFTFVFYAVYMAESKSSQIALKKAVFCLLSIFCIRVFSGNADLKKYIPGRPRQAGRKTNRSTENCCQFFLKKIKDFVKKN